MCAFVPGAYLRLRQRRVTILPGRIGHGELTL